MKKLAAIIVFISLTVTTVQAQWFGKSIRGNHKMVTETRTTSDYDGIGVAGSFDVKLVEGKEGKITINAEENLIPYIITEVDNNTLKIKWKKGYSISTNKHILVTVPFKSISKVSLAGSGDVYTDNATITSDNLKASLSGSGDIRLDVKTGKLEARIAGSGDIELTGITDDLSASIAGSGDVKSYDLLAKNGDLRISGSGGIKANVSDMLKVSIAGSGDVTYKGNPKEDVRISGSGSVRSKE
ncbi:MAG: DUF2807 domain-containing protein [Flavobacteriales bacterium]|nr:DUF2807 domain-containing protein [Flavobacteriales bacterium]